MREIKFKGKRVDNGEWVYGNLIKFSDMAYIHETTTKNPMHLLETFMHKIDPKTVGQYTGLKDKSGIKIYEGDIVKNIISVRIGTRTETYKRTTNRYAKYEDKECNGFVVFEDFKYKIKWIANDNYPSYFFCTKKRDNPTLINEQIIHNIEKNTVVEVIGNIHENPELLEDK
jgi:uncharacterized phage protein (TIGR01671 family)